MKKLILSFITICIIIVSILAVDYFTLGFSKDFVNSVLGIDEVYVHGEDSLSLYQNTIDNNKSNKLSLKCEKDGYKFNPGNDYMPDNLSMHALLVDSANNGNLLSGIDSISFKVKVNAINKLYVSTGYSDFEQKRQTWYDTKNNYYISSNVNSTPIFDSMKKLQVLSIGQDTYKITLMLDSYYSHKKISVRNAFLLISYIGNETITIYDIDYKEKQQNIIHTDYDLVIYDNEFSFSDNSLTIELLDGYITTNKNLTRIFASCYAGSFDIGFTQTVHYGEQNNYYSYDFKSARLNSAWWTETDVNVDIYVVYNDIAFKVNTIPVHVNGWDVPIKNVWAQ